MVLSGCFEVILLAQKPLDIHEPGSTKLAIDTNSECIYRGCVRALYKLRLCQCVHELFVSRLWKVSLHCKNHQKYRLASFVAKKVLRKLLLHQVEEALSCIFR